MKNILLTGIAPLMIIGTAALAQPDDAEVRAQPAIGAALVQLGDLQRAGRIGVAEGQRAMEFYSTAAADAPPEGILAIIPPEDLFPDVQLAQAQEGVSADHGTNALGADASYELAARMGSTDALLRLGDLYREGTVVPADPERAFQYFLLAAERGSQTGMLTASRMLIDGEGTPRDVEGGMDRLERAAEEGSAEARLLLGHVLARGVEGALEPDPQRAFEHYRAAGEMGSLTAKIEAGRRLIAGEGIVRDIDSGLAMLQEAADAGDTSALLQLGAIYAQGMADAMPADPTAAFGIYERAAEAGSSTGRALMGQMLLSGEGTQRDVPRGVAELERAASDGSTLAMIALGDIYAEGRPDITRPNRATAQSYYNAAVETGSLPAMVRAGRLMLSADGADEREDGISLLEEAGASGSSDAYLALAEHFNSAAGGNDRAQAFQYYSRAADAGSTTARLAVADRLIRGEGTDPDPEVGIAMLQELADGGEVRALISLGDIYASGAAGDVDADAAIRAYEEAADLGESDAFLRLGDLYRDGTIVPTDGERAVSYYAQAAGVSQTD